MEALTTATRRDSSVRMCSKAAVSSVRSPAWAAALQRLHRPTGSGQEAQARPGDQARGRASQTRMRAAERMPCSCDRRQWHACGASST